MSKRMTDKILKVDDIAGIEAFSSRFARLGDLYLLSHIETESAGDADTVLPESDVSLRLDGLLFIMVQRGRIDIRVNTESYKIDAGNLIVVRTGSLIAFTKLKRPATLKILFISTTFLRSLNIDLNAEELRYLFTNPRMVIRLEPREIDVIRRYFDLLDSNAADTTGSVFSTRVARMLISSVTYELLRFGNTHQLREKGYETEVENDSQSHKKSYVYGFLRLLHMHYARERNLEFYARNLCITPKYLSMMTKEVTGSTAAEWINRVVIQEAKNMLRYSDKSVQQIAYALNFPSQSAFGKFFKRMEGQSPTQFLKKVAN